MAWNRVRIFISLVLLLSIIAVVQAETLTTSSDYYAKGNDLVTQGKLEDALQAFRAAGSMDQRSLDETYGLSYQIGWILNRMGRYEESLEEFKKAEKIGFRCFWITYLLLAWIRMY